MVYLQLQKNYIQHLQLINPNRKEIMILQTQTQIYKTITPKRQAINFHPLIQKTPLENNSNESQIVINQLFLQIRNSLSNFTQNSLKILESLIQKGYSSLILKQVYFLKKLMIQFVNLSRQVQVKLSLFKKSQSNTNKDFRLIYMLSLIAQLIRQNPKFYFPFIKRFLLAVFQIDYDLLKQNEHKNDIVAILSVIYQNFSKQGRLITRYKLQERFKVAVLENYSLIEELFTIKSFNRALVNLVKSGVKLQSYEFKKYKILQTLTNFIQEKQIKIFTLRLIGLRHCNSHITSKFD